MDDTQRDIIQTTLLPGVGIGNSIRLGHSMYEVVNKLNNFGYKLTIGYSEENYLKNPILVVIPEVGLRLVFDNSGSQKLILVEIIDLDCIRVFYKGIGINEIELSLEDENNNLRLSKKVSYTSLKRIYNVVFGPTYPGFVSRDGHSYFLSYPGIAFRFRLKLDKLIKKLTGPDNLKLFTLLNWEKQEDIELQTIAVFEGDSWAKFSDLLKNPGSSDGLSMTYNAEIDIKEGIIWLYKSSGKVLRVHLGQTTQQEIMSFLGPPQDYFNKLDSRLVIKNKLAGPNDTGKEVLGSVWKFHNYFDHGIDFLYDLNGGDPSLRTGVLKKVIFHNGNIAESMDFLKWNRCNWRINDVDAKVAVDSSMAFSDIMVQMNKLSGGESPQPILLNRSESEFVESDLDIINYAELTSVSLSEKRRTWGQSKLYGSYRSVWEVLNSNNCVTALTIY